MAKIIVPVGYPTGAHFPAKGETEELEYNVVIGKDLVARPSAEYYQAWQLLFTDGEAHRELRFTRDHLIKLIEDAGLEDPAELVDTIEERGLIANFEVDDKSSITFLKKYRLIPQGIGAGNTQADPTMFNIQIGDRIVVSLMYDLYGLWMGNESWSSMWDRFRNYTKNRPNVPDLDNDRLSYVFAASIPGIVASGAGFLMKAT